MKPQPIDAKHFHWLIPGMRVKRYVAMIGLGMMAISIGIVHVVWQASIVDWFWTITGWTGLRQDGTYVSGLLWMLLGAGVLVSGIQLLNRSIVSVFADPKELAKEIYQHRMLSSGPRMVALGGGTGLSHILKGLRQKTSNLTAVVAISDDGGSTGRLRNAFDIPAVGDMVDCLSALSVTSKMGDLMEYRFSRGGDLEGHTFGNLMLTSLSELEGDFAAAMRNANQILRLAGEVWPASYQAAKLIVRKADGRKIIGESQIQHHPGRISRVDLYPKYIAAMPEAVQAIEQAELIVLGPGSLYSSIIPSFLPKDISKAIKNSKAPLVYVANVMSEQGETDDMTTFECTKAIGDHLGRWPDVVVVNTAAFMPKVLQRYKDRQQQPIVYRKEDFAHLPTQLIEGDFITYGTSRHDPDAVVKALMELYNHHK